MKIVFRRINQKMFPFVALGLIVVIGSGSRRAEAARVHLIAVGDTLDKDIGRSIEEDLGSLVGTFEQIGKKSLLEPVVLQGVDCNPTAINESLDKLHIHSGDAVVFYFTGHGAYDKENGQFLQIPRLGKDGDVSRNQIRDKLKGWVDARQIRLGVLMTDMCNLQKIIAMPNPPPPFSKPYLWIAKVLLMSLRLLPMKPQPHIQNLLFLATKKACATAVSTQRFSPTCSDFTQMTGLVGRHFSVKM
jgi:hypothetical protein